MSTEPNAPSDLLALSPCPFCGMAPELGPLFVPSNNGRDFTTIECVNPNCAIQPGVERVGNDNRAPYIPDHREAAIAAWNSRPSLSAQAVGEPVAWQWRLKGEGDYLWASCRREQAERVANDPEWETRALYTTPPQPADGGERVAELVAADRAFDLSRAALIEVSNRITAGSRSDDDFRKQASAQHSYDRAADRRRAALAKFQPAGGES